MAEKKEKTIAEMKATSLRRKNALIGYSFIAPNFIGFAIFILFPVLFTIALSVMDWDGFNAMQFAGLDNFQQEVEGEEFVTRDLRTNPMNWGENQRMGDGPMGITVLAGLRISVETGKGEVLGEGVLLRGVRVNLHIAVSGSRTAAGTPVIFGGF